MDDLAVLISGSCFLPVAWTWDSTSIIIKTPPMASSWPYQEMDVTVLAVQHPKPQKKTLLHPMYGSFITLMSKYTHILKAALYGPPCQPRKMSRLVCCYHWTNILCSKPYIRLLTSPIFERSCFTRVQPTICSNRRESFRFLSHKAVIRRRPLETKTRGET